MQEKGYQDVMEEIIAQEEQGKGKDPGDAEEGEDEKGLDEIEKQVHWINSKK